MCVLWERGQNCQRHLLETTQIHACAHTPLTTQCLVGTLWTLLTVRRSRKVQDALFKTVGDKNNNKSNAAACTKETEDYTDRYVHMWKQSQFSSCWQDTPRHAGKSRDRGQSSLSSTLWSHQDRNAGSFCRNCVVIPGDDVQEGQGSLTGPAGGSIQQLLQRIRPF